MSWQEKLEFLSSYQIFFGVSCCKILLENGAECTGWCPPFLHIYFQVAFAMKEAYALSSLVLLSTKITFSCKICLLGRDVKIYRNQDEY